jgi:hypothetical protein
MSAEHLTTSTPKRAKKRGRPRKLDGEPIGYSAMRSRIRRDRAPRLPFICLKCGEDLEGRQSNTLFCGSICRDRFNREKAKPSRICRQCGSEFLGSANRDHCSDECGRKTRYLRGRIRAREGLCHLVFSAKWRKKKCVVCGSPFEATQDRARYCSVVCRSKCNRIARAACRQPRETKNCKECGKAFSPYSHASIHCSKVCRRRYNGRNRRAKKAGLFVEPVPLAYLMARDKGICQLCGKPVDPGQIVPSPLAPTIDHIHPTSKGGMHSKANTQLAHFRCNNKKGAKVA